MSMAHVRLHPLKYNARLLPVLGQDLDVADEILTKVMRKAPSRMSFASAVQCAGTGCA